MKTKAEYMELINEGIAKMEPRMKQLGLKLELYRIHENPTAQELVEANKWVQEILENEYHEMVKIYNLMPPDAWAAYELMDMNDSREAILLKGVTTRFKKALRSRPIVFYKTKSKHTGE